jgi:hypothetical protein
MAYFMLEMPVEIASALNFKSKISDQFIIIFH